MGMADARITPKQDTTGPLSYVDSEIWEPSVLLQGLVALSVDALKHAD